MGITELVDWLERLETRSNSYWNFYTIVLVAVCGWVVSRGGQPAPIDGRIALMAGLSVFYCMNLSIIYATVSRIRAVEGEIRRLSRADDAMGEPLKRHLANPLVRFRVRGTVALHLAMDALVLVFVWIGLGTAA